MIPGGQIVHLKKIQELDLIFGAQRLTNIPSNIQKVIPLNYFKTTLN